MTKSTTQVSWLSSQLLLCRCPADIYVLPSLLGPEVCSLRFRENQKHLGLCDSIKWAMFCTEISTFLILAWSLAQNLNTIPLFLPCLRLAWSNPSIPLPSNCTHRPTERTGLERSSERPSVLSLSLSSVAPRYFVQFFSTSSPPPKKKKKREPGPAHQALPRFFSFARQWGSPRHVN